MTNPKPLVVRYTNWRGETDLRHLHPILAYYGATEFHPEPQWLLEAKDIERGVDRTFALEDMAGARETSRLIKTAADEQRAQVGALHRAYAQTTEGQTAAVALAQLWEMLGAQHQTDAVMKLRVLLGEVHG